MTSAPASARRSAVAAPRAPAPPVTSTVCPAREKDSRLTPGLALRPVQVEGEGPLLGVEGEVAHDLVGVGGELLAEAPQVVVGLRGEQHPEELDDDHGAHHDARDAVEEGDHHHEEQPQPGRPPLHVLLQGSTPGCPVVAHAGSSVSTGFYYPAADTPVRPSSDPKP